MTTIDPSGYSEAGAHLFTWLADKVLGGAKKAFGWGWTQVEWAKAQDRYDARIIQDYGQIRIFGQTTPKSLKDIFTDVYVLDTPTAYRRFDPAALAEHLWNEDRGLAFRHEERRPGEQLLEQGSKFYILGKPGAGKTTFLKHLAVREAQRGKWGPCLGKIPIFVSLKQFGEKSQSLFDFIVDEFAVCGFPEATPFVEALLKSGQALVLFDGLDEVSKSEEHDRRGEVTRMLAQFARQYGECHIVVTCRIAAVDYTFEPAFAYLEMADFAPDQMDAFVRAWFWDDSDKDKGAALAEGMLAALELPEHKGIRDLSRNPLLLTLLCLNYAETRPFPARRVDIFSEALDVLLRQWDESWLTKRSSFYKSLTLGRKQQMFAQIAFDTFSRNEVIFPQTNLERWLAEYSATVPGLPLVIDIDGHAILREIVAQHGIFAEQARRLYSFAHLTFQEYYVARFIADNATPDTLDTLLSHVTDEKWRDIFLLTASLFPDATAFLIGFERTLHRLVASCPRLVVWLHWIDDRAVASQAAYRLPATRVLYARDLVLARDRSEALAPDLVSACDRSRALALNLTLTLDPNFARERERARDRDLARTIHNARTLSDLHPFFSHEIWSDLIEASDDVVDLPEISSDLIEARDYVVDLCERQRWTDLYWAITALTVPDIHAPSENWARYGSELAQVIEAQGTPKRYRQLLAEIDALRKERKDHWSLDNTDFAALIAYIDANRLFYDCLQLAYTPDHRAFEDRIFWLPPDPNQQ